MDLARIGEFARLSRLSPKALPLYDSLGLLRPAHIDPESGYRWYAISQLELARLVALLRGLGLPLAQIGLILRLDGPAAAGQVARYWGDVEAEHADRRELAAGPARSGASPPVRSGRSSSGRGPRPGTAPNASSPSPSSRAR